MYVCAKKASLQCVRARVCACVAPSETLPIKSGMTFPPPLASILLKKHGSVWPHRDAGEKTREKQPEKKKKESERGGGGREFQLVF